MTKEELEAQALKLDTKERARLAGRLLESLSGPENTEIWAEEAQRRDANLDEDPDSDRPVEAVLNEARSRLK